MMVREWGAKFVVHRQAKAIILASAAVLLIGTFICAGPALAQPDTCAGGQLGPGNPANPQDLKISNECHVGGGLYTYRNVNIVTGGSGDSTTAGKLIFDEKLPKVKIDFWASSILVENGGSLLAPSRAPQNPFACRSFFVSRRRAGAAARLAA